MITQQRIQSSFGGWLLILWMVLIPSLAFSDTCKDHIPDWDDSFTKYEGSYYNCPYAYAFTLPEGLMGRGEAPGHTEHGIGILLSEQPYGYIYTDGSPDWTEEECPLCQISSTHTDWIRKDAQRILSVEQFEIMIDKQPGLRLIIHYLCPGGKEKVEDYMFTRNYGKVYTVALLADKERYDTYKTIVERIIKTFQFKEWPCPLASQVKMNRGEIMDIAKIEELKQSELLSEWIGFVAEADVLACRRILHATIDKLLDAGPQKVAEIGPSIITEAVLALNEIDNGFICTIEREDLCEFFEDLGEQCGLNAEDIEEALNHREW